MHFKRNKEPEAPRSKDYDFAEMVKAAREQPKQFSRLQKAFDNLKKKPKGKSL
ncbi:hypothetical protein [Lacticaseibacillus saniviri]|uniref:hypothetical protein n=1 Tax=Lacticaseibacillus saniviri TaxID=931533 RepID=UPI001EE11EDF|nr:hypothetical protein [Lacticaseibacillus saniviri]MCG4283098.1 hypothetical protein [Lacticaseibacillus saniviri]